VPYCCTSEKINQSKNQKGERELRKYKDEIQMADDFHAPLNDFKEGF